MGVKVPIREHTNCLVGKNNEQNDANLCYAQIRIILKAPTSHPTPGTPAARPPARPGPRPAIAPACPGRTHTPRHTHRVTPIASHPSRLTPPNQVSLFCLLSIIIFRDEGLRELCGTFSNGGYIGAR